MVADGQTVRMSHLQQPVRPRVPWKVIVGVGFAAAVVIATLTGISLAQGRNADERPAPAAQQSTVVSASSAAAAVDTSGLAKYWADTCLTIDGCDLATAAPQWDGSWLTLRTDLFPDSDAKAPATVLCGALSGYWLSTPGGADNFHAVRVLDKAGNVLISRHSFGEQCSWKR